MPNQFGLPTEDELMKSIYPSENKKITNKRKKLSRAVEKAIFIKYNGKCAICDIKTPFDYGEIDHIKPISKGGSPTAPSNLQWLCHRCNKLKGANRTNAQVKELIGESSKEKSRTDLSKVKLYKANACVIG